MERGDLTAQREAGSGSEELVAQVSRAMARLYKESYGKGPTRARTHLIGDLIVCLLEGVLLRGERTLRDGGRGDAVTIQRVAVEEVVRHRFVETIEELTHRKVASYISGVDIESEVSAGLFVLEPLEFDTGDERDAVNAWARQTRRQAQDLRDRSARLRRLYASLWQSRPPAGSERPGP